MKTRGRETRQTERDIGLKVRQGQQGDRELGDRQVEGGGQGEGEAGGGEPSFICRESAQTISEQIATNWTCRLGLSGCFSPSVLCAEGEGQVTAAADRNSPTIPLTNLSLLCEELWECVHVSARFVMFSGRLCVCGGQNKSCCVPTLEGSCDCKSARTFARKQTSVCTHTHSRTHAQSQTHMRLLAHMHTQTLTFESVEFLVFNPSLQHSPPFRRVLFAFPGALFFSPPLPVRRLD